MMFEREPNFIFVVCFTLPKGKSHKKRKYS